MSPSFEELRPLVEALVLSLSVFLIVLGAE